MSRGKIEGRKREKKRGQDIKRKKRIVQKVHLHLEINVSSSSLEAGDIAGVDIESG